MDWGLLRRRLWGLRWGLGDDSVHPAGSSARQPTYFLCFAKESRQRKATPAPLPLLRRGPCDARSLGPAARNALRSLRSLRLNGRAESDVERALRALAPGSCASRQLQGGPTPNSQQPITEQPASLHPARRFPAVGCLAVGCSPSEAAEQRSGLGRARSALPLLDQGGRSNGESAANEVRSALQPQAVSSAGNARPSGRGQRSGRVFFASFLARARKGVACRGDIPAGCTGPKVNAASRAIRISQS